LNLSVFSTWNIAIVRNDKPTTKNIVITNRKTGIVEILKFIRLKYYRFLQTKIKCLGIKTQYLEVILRNFVKNKQDGNITS
jgi:hypothetical protein